MNGILGKLLGKGPPPLVGVDIGTSSIKVVQLAGSGDAVRLEAFGVEPLPDNAVSEGVIGEPEPVAAALRQVIKRAGVTAKRCAMAVSGSAVITKMINLPDDLSEDDIEAQIEVEAGHYIPYPREEVSLDFEVLGPSPRNADLLEILLAASKTEHVDMRREVADLAGLTIQVVDVESFAVSNAFDLVRQQSGIDESETLAVLNIGAVSSTMIVLRGNRSIYSREHSFGGNLLVEECMRRYGMDANQARFLQRGEAPPAGFEDEVLEPFRQNIIQQISRALQFYASSSDYMSLGTLYLTGGGALIPGLAEALGDEVGISTELGDPLKSMRLSPRINARQLDQVRPALTIATGLALRGFD
ncbi:type IV pilus assembly protein PilM [Wenzhouxiangella limi]|uniref:Pilus assembly protein PilM n=1 Tax=Wenzhouxiangella limi TaxID=2707351 RepID=A0A845UZV8_9GAMM|nr:type IV pilus assembly protein PilM [Wenzhouxiangella limi]NDY96004.1 pilus assembly protein PilM [Wenzhouxiangella limi]